MIAFMLSAKIKNSDAVLASPTIRTRPITPVANETIIDKIIL